MDATNRNTALASAMVEELARCGVRHAVLSPGSRSTPLSLALWRQPEIEVSVIVDERSAGFFALGAAQATRTAVAVLCTSGTAAANLHPAVCEADESGVPLVVLTADRPPELRDVGAGQTIDQLKLYGAAVRWFCEVGTYEADDAGLLHFRSVACRAYASAAGDPRPGPVHLNVPWRDPLGPEPRPDDVTATGALALRGRGERPLTTTIPATPAPRPELIEALADRVATARRGVVVVGRLPGPDAASAIAALGAATGYPILAEPTSQLRFGGHDRRLIVSHYAAIARSRPAALAPDLVLRFGEMPTSKALRSWIAVLSSEGCPLLVVDASWDWNEPTRAAGAMVRADAAALAGALAQRLHEPAAEPGWAKRWLDADRALRDSFVSELGPAAEPSGPSLWPALAAALSDGELVYTASSMPIRDQEAFLPSHAAEVLFLANRGANGIDGLVSSGIGAAHASGRPTWIVTGDLGVFHDMNSLATLRHVSVPVRVVVLNNDGGGIFEFLPQASQLGREEFEALLGTPLGLELERVAELHGLDYRRLSDLGSLAEVRNETALIEVPVDRAAEVALHARLDSLSAAALAHVS